MPSDPSYRFSRTWMLLGALCLGTLLNWHSGLAQSERCSILFGEQVSGALATLRMLANRPNYRRGEPIRVTLTLKAGPNGVYLPAYFADFIKTCEHGFAASLLTPAGKTADPDGPGCVGGGLHTIDTAQTELNKFVRLEPGEIRTWQTTLETAAIDPGRYCLYAEYLSFGYMIDDVARLPEVRGLMARGRITATPIPLDLRSTHRMTATLRLVTAMLGLGKLQSLTDFCVLLPNKRGPHVGRISCL
jgi:hypothetical protein